MKPEEYAAQQAALTAGLAAYIRKFATLFAGPLLSIKDWIGLLQILFPEVQKRYEMSASLGRNFYDSQRKTHHPELVRNEMLLTELSFDQFVKNMEPARKAMSQADSSNAAVTNMSLTVVREVEMAARRQIIGAVKNDPEPVLQGWARVATGDETCAWCLMLISRGAELNHKGNFAYSDAKSAGINLDDDTVIDLYNGSNGDFEKFRKAIKDDIEKWHTGCDCLAVPVFDIEDWPGRDAARKALQLWIDAGLEADELIKAGKSRTRNNYTETLNALRRRLSRGEITMSDYAIAA